MGGTFGIGVGAGLFKGVLGGELDGIVGDRVEGDGFGRRGHTAAGGCTLPCCSWRDIHSRSLLTEYHRSGMLADILLGTILAGQTSLRRVAVVWRLLKAHESLDITVTIPELHWSSKLWMRRH